jgi:holliday junction DNA helicase RuvA
MIAYIKGLLQHFSPISVVIETGGIGYRVFIPISVFSKLPNPGEMIMLHTSYVIREQSQTLYGFLNEQDCLLFDQLLNVSGVGPKLALSLIGHLSIQELSRAVGEHDLVTLCKVPGVGKKTAERLVIEMRDKMEALTPIDPSRLAIPLHSDFRSQQVSDVINALINLGYNQAIAQKAIRKTLTEVPETIDLSVLITHALKNI